MRKAKRNELLKEFSEMVVPLLNTVFMKHIDASEDGVIFKLKVSKNDINTYHRDGLPLDPYIEGIYSSMCVMMGVINIYNSLITIVSHKAVIGETLFDLIKEYKESTNKRKKRHLDKLGQQCLKSLDDLNTVTGTSILTHMIYTKFLQETMGAYYIDDHLYNEVNMVIRDSLKNDRFKELLKEYDNPTSRRLPFKFKLFKYFTSFKIRSILAYVFSPYDTYNRWFNAYINNTTIEYNSVYGPKFQETLKILSESVYNLNNTVIHNMFKEAVTYELDMSNKEIEGIYDKIIRLNSSTHNLNSIIYTNLNDLIFRYVLRKLIK